MLRKRTEYSEYVQRNIDRLNQVFGNVTLSVEEENSLLWLCCWEDTTIENLVSAISRAIQCSLDDHYLKNAEMSAESNYNMIDGLINNEFQESESVLESIQAKGIQRDKLEQLPDKATGR
ncbi:DUF4316 domain-containing protein [Clostridium formicaceticum]|uniref:DUF4316 domain-containing protein n=1 Tax=Clostridium formicaceticum TaxID=1497 RepID=A0AAC9RQI7_9CLOT|nr:DUF4316 domain-containing protein [Clostridium formicaceticum]AOY74737.1 hypothetical protein BJL90_01465 [Clostridium formicaceticum]ARE89123.1 hypothetical protein CLFO_35290 [Clostridium formicaceticum]